MNITLAIPVTVAILLAIMFCTIIIGRGHWFIKVLLIASSLYFTIALHFALKGLTGWPCEGDLPEQFLIHYSLVREPDKKGGDPGEIIIWHTALNEELEVSSEGTASWLKPFGIAGHPGDPRAVRVPYSRKLHEQMSEANQKSAQGRPMIGRSGGEGGKRKGRKGDGSSSRDDEIILHDLPPAKLPEKITN